ncbi:MAG: SpoIVB peptidase S55 domain-containing protein [Terracidiphilus sp.]|nr:SpoIVB peptidase S55 domain-containing protein [Terracidiphilus sp.]MDR3797389.1 SpoIVB peptidase S55 domain-containing protein [Terracidiphilus sp.]
METRPNANKRGLCAPAYFSIAYFLFPALAVTAPALLAAQAAGQKPAAASAQQPAAQPPGAPRNPAFFPLNQIRPGMTGTAWTIFQGSTPEPMQVEILGVLRGARGPGQDLILAKLHGAKPEFTGVVDGMSGSPVYIDGKLVGALSYRIGQFTKEPIAGITPIAQMIEVRDLSAAELAVGPPASADARSEDTERVGDNASPSPLSDGKMIFRPMETPLVLSGFRPEAIRFWQQQTAGTALETVAAGGASGSSGSSSAPGKSPEAPVPPSLQPGSSVSMLLVRGDVEVAATCTITYIDPRQLLACGHPVLGAGPVSLPMTTTDVITTVASPLDAFKIINTGVTIGAFTQDRESAIHGVFGARAQMIPMHISMDVPTGDAPTGQRRLNVEILDLPSLTPIAMQVVLLNALTQTNEGSEALSYHLTGSIELSGYPSMPLDLWAPAASGLPASMQTVILAGQQFTRLYSNGARQGVIRQIDLHIQAVPRPMQVTLERAHFVSGNIAHAGDTVEVEATLRPWQEPERNVRIAFRLPARLAAGNLRLLISDGATLDRTLLQPRPNAPPADLATVLAEARDQHPADRIYVSVLAPEAQGQLGGNTLTSLPLSMANALEPLRNTQNASLNGESAELAAEAPAGGVLTGFQVLNIHIEPGGGLN